MSIPYRRFFLLAGVLATSCSSEGTKRETGQNELFKIDPVTFQLSRTLPGPNSAGLAAPTFDRPAVDASFGDPIRYNDDVVALQVLSVYLDHVPVTLTGSRDVIVFAEVWENGASGYSTTPLNTVINISRNQLIPGRLSFEGNIGYGPTIFKGHPLKIRFTVMILQKESGKRAASAADVVGNFATAATLGTPYSAIASSITGIIREVLRAQPDVIAMDYEYTGLSHAPKGFRDLILASAATNTTSVAAADVSLKTLTTAAANTENPAAIEAISVAKVAQKDLEEAKIAFTKAAVTDKTARTPSKITELYVTKTSSTASNEINWALPNAEREAVVQKVVNDINTKADTSERPAAKNLSEASTKLTNAVKESKAAVEGLSALFPAQTLDASWPWLRYGLYAVVETCSRNMIWRGRQSSDDGKLGIDDNILFDQGWLFPVTSSGKADRSAPLGTNYLVFSLSPHQLTENNDILLAASQADGKLLSELRQAPSDLKSSGEAVQTFATQLVRRIGESRAENIARTVALRLERASNNGTIDATTFATEFGSAFDKQLAVLSDKEAGTESDKWKSALKERLTEEWKARITERSRR